MKGVHPSGKIPSSVLGRWLEKYTHSGPDILSGAGIGQDAAVILPCPGGPALALKTDPITFATDRIGFYAVSINANDISCVGARPRWFLATVLLPEAEGNLSLGEDIFAQIDQACRKLGISCCGGHTEVTAGIDRPIVVGQMLGVADKESIKSVRDGRAGDAVLITRGAAIEATSIMAREKSGELEKSFDQDFVTRCKEFVDNPGLSVVEDALALASVRGVHALHDPTEGGVLMGVKELAMGAGTGIEIDADLIPVYPETQRLCRFFGIDPLRVLASGMLAASVAPEAVPAAIEVLARRSVPAGVIGCLVGKEKGFKLKRNGSWTEFPESEQDQIALIF